MNGTVAPRFWLAMAAALAVSGCVNLGEDPPPSLLTLTAANVAPAGAASAGRRETLLAILEPDAPQRLNVTRVPVQISDSSVAYLKDAQWVDKPARLFQRLVGEAVRAKGTRTVIDAGDLQYAAATKLTGNLSQMGYDSTTGSAVVRFDAVLSQPDGNVLTRRFEAVVPGVTPEAAAVGAALNQAANQVSGEVADWIG